MFPRRLAQVSEFCHHGFSFIVLLALAAATISLTATAWADCSSGTLTNGNGEDLVISNACTVNAGMYKYGNVNIVSGGTLTFTDAVIDFWAASILVENNGALEAGVSSPIGTAGGVLTIHLYGKDQGANGSGITCKTDNICGIPQGIWDTNGSTLVTLPGGYQDYFYQYQPLDYDGGNSAGYFGYKVLAVSYGGTLQLFGAKGVAVHYPADLKPWQSGTSWARLNNNAAAQTNSLQLDRIVDWAANDEIVVTTTDYLPGHSEELTVIGNDTTSGVSIITVAQKLQYPHYGQVYPFPATLPVGVGPDPDPNVDAARCGTSNGQALRCAETRAAVGLLKRSIRIVSEGDNLGDPFPPESGHYFFGAHTVFRQGFKAVQLQGVEFHQMGQGGKIMHYPVHFHMARQTPSNTFIADCSISESMTRWVVVHGTLGVTVERNVGWKSIGHGFYLEDGSEIDNKFYSNLGIFARAGVTAVDDSHEKYNPRHVPGILAARYPAWNDPLEAQEKVPYHSDIDHPTDFWIMNGWNDFEYNHAAGAGTCGMCYWLVPGGVSTMSRDQKWSNYAAEQLKFPDNAGTTPLKTFNGNTCSTAMVSFNTVGDTFTCHGVVNENPAANLPVLVPVPNPLAPPPNDQNADSYYPRVLEGGGRFATECPNDGTDCSQITRCSAGQEALCEPTIIDRFTSQYSWAETNFSSVWFRPQWYLYLNSVLADVQNGGLTMVTGGGYTASDVIPGHWAFATKNAFIGNTQPNTSQYSSNAGPVTPTSALKCARRSDGSPGGGFCLVRDISGNEEDISLQESNFSVNQRMFNIYDGPAYESSNAYLDVTTTPVTDCSPGPSPCWNSGFAAGWSVGILQDKNGRCFLPNAAIGWKQPNGFYYPPAFHSESLFYNNVDIRHFVIEPQLKPGTFLTNDDEVQKLYCTYNPSGANGIGGLFQGFTDIDRQTELTDDDGTLTGLYSGNTGPTISVNEDPFFNAPLETTECASNLPDAPPPAATAKTSPYDYVTSAIVPDCVQTCDQDVWSAPCTTEQCYGVPLYREFVNQNELGTKPYVRMAGQAIGQRSTLTVNNGFYYLDTTVPSSTQHDPLYYSFYNVFQPQTTYNVFLVFAKPNTVQKYSMYVGAGFNVDTDVQAIRAHTEGANSQPVYFTQDAWPSTWTKSFNPANDVLTVTMNMNFTEFQTDYMNGMKGHCAPQNFCSWTGGTTSGSCGCALSSADPLYNDCQNVCSKWAVKDVDCPDGGCFGFSFKTSANFTTGAKDHLPPDTGCYDTSSTGPWNPGFSRHDASGQQCYYSTLPVIQTCTQPSKTGRASR